MIEFRPYKAGHLRYVIPQAAQKAEHAKLVTQEDALEASSLVGISAWQDGVCLGAAGVLPVWKERAYAWALLSVYAAPHLMAITRKVRYVVQTFPANRVEMVVRTEFKEGHRWARVLGFRQETPDGMPGYFEDGGSATLYARVRNGSSS